MKNVMMLATFFLFGVLNAQSPVSEDAKAMSDGVYNALTIELPDVNPKLADKVWRDYVKQYGGKTRKVKKGDEWLTDDAKLYDVGGTSLVDIFCLSEGVGDDTKFSVWFNVEGNYVSSSSNPDAYDEAEKFMLRFGLAVTRAKIKLELESEEKELKNLENELKKRQKEKERLEKDIAEAQKKIKRSEESIKQNLVDQEKAVEAIEGQKQAVKNVQRKLDSVRE